MIKIGIIGYGYWGPNLVRNFSGIEQCIVKKVADRRKERIDALARNYPSVSGVMSDTAIINDPDIDAVIVATPVFTHYDIALRALKEGKHVLIEKPMTSTSGQALGLIELAEQKQRVLMVDHTYLYTGAVQKIKEMIDSNVIGSINYFDSTRINLGLFQPDINVLWDLSPHDISILNFIYYKEKPYSVHATGTCHTGNGIENIAYLTINYQSGFIAHFNCSWSSPVKIRMMVIGGDKKMIVFNDLEPTEKVKLYDTGYTYTTDEEKYNIRVDYRSGDVYIPKLGIKEALSFMANDFVNAITKKTIPVSDFNSGLSVIKILEASNESLKNKGKEVIIK
jgi:predicted dehydrogenase